jgi:serine/threonine-protein phosphatase CPPED1
MLGINSSNKEWQTEIEYCKKAIEFVHEMATKPAFICICGDIVDMEPDDPYYSKMGTREDRIEMQKRQFEDFKITWRALSADIPLICLCGNHDVGNKPTVESIARYTSQLGDDYFAFWCKGCYNVVLNSNLYYDKSNAPYLFDEQHAWVEERLKYARAHNARRIFVYAHHPWFMDNENDADASLTGGSPIFGGKVVIPDAYFFVKYEARRELMQMFKDYGVTACFAGHYHQNLISRSTWGMPMIVTGPLCNWLLESNAKDIERKENITEAAGLRIVHVDESADGFSHTYEVIATHNLKSFP